jgi:hypothetical protein
MIESRLKSVARKSTPHVTQINESYFRDHTKPLPFTTTDLFNGSISVVDFPRLAALSKLPFRSPSFPHVFSGNPGVLETGPQ